MTVQATTLREKIRIDGLSHTYLTRTREIPALDGLTLSVVEGEFCSIVGPSGCGKSTLLSIIAGLILPTEGQVHLDGVPVRGPSRNLGFLLQRDHLFDWRTVQQNAELGLEIIGKNTAGGRQRVHALLEAYGLGSFKGIYPHQLSGGMRQRVALVRTLATDPDILLLDEPFSALDYQTKLILEGDIHRIIRSSRKTALLVTHDIEEAVAMSDRVLVLSGRPASLKSGYDVTLSLTGDRTPLAARDAPEFRKYCNLIWEELAIDLRMV